VVKFGIEKSTSTTNLTLIGASVTPTGRKPKIQPLTKNNTGVCPVANAGGNHDCYTSINTSE